MSFLRALSSTGLYLSVLLLSNSVCTQATTPNVTGNCKSGFYPFTDSKIARPNWLNPTAADPDLFDYQIDYGTDQYAPLPGNVAALRLTKNPEGPHASGIRISTTRFVLYGKITFRFKGIAVPGVITTAITMSDAKDEIDFEMVGSEPSSIQTNVFYRGITEYVVHFTNETLPNGGRIDDWHNYTIDWRSDRIDWLIDGQLKRRLLKENSVSRFIGPNEKWFPTTPSLIQMSVWDGGPSQWSGGPVPWPTNVTQYEAQYASVEVVCYNDKDEPVSYWPPVQGRPAPTVISSAPRTTSLIPTPSFVATTTAPARTVPSASSTPIKTGVISASKETSEYHWSVVLTMYMAAVFLLF